MARNQPKKWLQNTLAVCFWLLLWQAASVCINSSILLVSPVAVVRTLLELVQQMRFWSTVAFTAARILSGFFVALVLGTLLAALAAKLAFLEVLLRPAMATVKSVPVASFIILALLWLKNAGNLAVFISFLMVLPLVYTNTLAGIRATPEPLLEMARLFRVPILRQVRYIYVPAMWPHCRAAYSVGLGLCWKSGIAAEVIGITSGSIGAALYNAKIFFSTAELFAWTVVIVIVSVLFEKLFLALASAVENRLVQGDGL